MTIFVPADALPRHRRPSRSSILEYDEEEEMEHRAQDGEEEERQQLQQRTSDAQQALPSRSRTPSFLSREISPLPSIGTSEGVVSTTRRQQPTTSAIPVAAANELSSMHAMIDRLQRPTASFLLPATSTTVALLPAASATVAACTASAIPVTVANDWSRVAERCRTHPHEVVDQDRRGRTCLHAAVAKKPPASVIRALLEACRSTSSSSSSRMAIGGQGESAAAAVAKNNNNNNNNDPSDICLERDKHGRTPLTIAICSNASVSVVDLLLRANPKAASVHDHLGHLPLHLACGAAAGYGEEEYEDQQVQLVRKLLAAFPEAATRESFNGRTALHAAMEARAPVQVVELLVKGKQYRVLRPLHMGWEWRERAVL